MTTDSVGEPTWDDDIRLLFASPYWITPVQRAATVAHGWRRCMAEYGITLTDYDSVAASAVTIYEHLASRSMPLTDDEAQYWPDEALGRLRTWIEQGKRRSASDPVTPVVIDLPPLRPVPRPRVRRDILDLSAKELDAYRERLEELEATSPSLHSTWQRVAYLHTDWCLHYQEAFVLWHRANLLYFEGLLGMAIPYWNFMSPRASQDGAPEAGLVKPFRDLSYRAPSSGETRPNPLRFGVAKDGRSKACAPGSAQMPPADQCRFVQRDPLLYTTGDTSRPEREAKLAHIALYQHQIDHALAFEQFSTPEGAPGFPWANITSFDPPPPDDDYPYRGTNFDGAYEQPHDNFHGWVGPDMADNAYTAFDPLFWSYHANIDRIFENWNRGHPAATYTANFPLRPFAGPLAREVDLTNPRTYVYTTIGDMAKDSRALGYDYQPPPEPDSRGRPHAPTKAATDAQDRLYIVFPDVRCTLRTYTVDVFVNLLQPTARDRQDGHADHYAGRMTRLGMGVEDVRGRCTPTGVTRVIDATHVAEHLGLPPGSTVDLSLIVTEVHPDRVVPAEEYRQLPGFAPIAAWGRHRPTKGAASCC